MKRRSFAGSINRGGGGSSANASMKNIRPSDSRSADYIPLKSAGETEENDGVNYALLIALYTLQGIPMGLSASIPFLIQQKIQVLSAAASSATSTYSTSSASSSSASAVAASAARMSYNANAIFALCSWPFSLKLIWAPIVDAIFFKRFGRRKSWVVPVQTVAGLLMVAGSNFVEEQLGLGSLDDASGGEGGGLPSMDIKGVTAFFFVLYFLMATQDIAVDGWALTMLSKKNRGRGPVMNSIGQNIGYFLSFVGFLALNDAESSETIWRPLLGLKSRPGKGLISLGGFIRVMGIFMLIVTTLVALFKTETTPTDMVSLQEESNRKKNEEISKDTSDDEELDAAEIGIKETYQRLWAVCQLPAVRWLFLILLTYRLPTSLSDNVKFLKAVELGLSKSTTALLSPTLILPLGILVPIIGAKVWHGHPLRQFMVAYKFRVVLVPLLDLLMLYAVRERQEISRSLYWFSIVASTASQAIAHSLQFNAQMTFFASRVDPSIGGTYMTLLNTAANLGGTWPSPVVMYLVGALTVPPKCEGQPEVCVGGRDSYTMIQTVLSLLGCIWIILLGGRVNTLAKLPDQKWRTDKLLTDGDIDEEKSQSKLGNKKNSNKRE